MIVTKYEHACFTVEIDGQLLVIDPGDFTKTLSVPANVAAIVITHEHQDHFDPQTITSLIETNPEAVLISLESIIDSYGEIAHSQKVAPGDTASVGPFNLAFFGGKHAHIHSSIPQIDNIGILINNAIYFPGDSFEVPHQPVKLLALPASGPWFKTSDAIDFMLDIKPDKAFPTHNIHNSEQGQKLFDRIVGGFAEHAGITYVPLDIEQSIEL